MLFLYFIEEFQRIYTGNWVFIGKLNMLWQKTTTKKECMQKMKTAIKIYKNTLKKILFFKK